MTIYCPRCGQAGCDETVISFVSVWASCARCHLVWRSSLLETVVGYAARGVGLSKSEKIAARYNALQKTEELQQPSGSLKPVSVDRVAEWLASQDRPTGAPRLAVTPHSAIEAAKVEEMFDMLDPVKKSDMSPVPTVPVRETAHDENDFFAFFAKVDADPKAAAPIAPVAPIAPSAAIAAVAPSDPLSFEDVLDEPQIPVVVQQTVVEVPQVIPEVPQVVVEVPQVVVEDLIEEPVSDSVNEMAADSSQDPLTSMDDLYEAFKRLEQQLDTISDSLQTYNQHP